MAWKQGKYKLRHPEKYKADSDNVIYRSSWELKMHKFLDENPYIIEWCSECIAIPYLKPTDRKIHKYYPDYYLKYKNKKGQIIQEIIEIKPQKQTKKTRKRKFKERLYEEIQYSINQAKWQSAQHFCNKYGLKFRIVTEKELYR